MRIYNSEKRFFVCLLMFIAFSFSVHGQELKEIMGQVIDAVEKTPVVFAAIQFKNNKNGNINNPILANQSVRKDSEKFTFRDFPSKPTPPEKSLKS